MSNNVLVVPNLYARAWSGEPLSGKSATHWHAGQKAVPLLELQPLHTTLRTRSAPALVASYAPPDDSRVFPRLAKAAQVFYMSLPDDEQPRLTSLLVDIDHENHTPPPAGWAADILSLLEAPFDDPMWYRTPNGLRLCWTLDEPVRIPLAQSYLTQALAHLRAMGVPTDEGTEDWTRLFRLPDREADLPLDVEPREPLAWTPPDPLTTEEVTALGKVVGTTMPTTPKQKLTRRELKPVEKLDERLSEALYSGTLRAPVGERHATLLGAAVKLAHAFKTNDPALIYDYLGAAADRMNKPADEVWSICGWAAASYSGAEDQDKSERQSVLLKTAGDMGCRPAEVSKRLIVDTGPEQFVWDEQLARYSAGYTKQHQLLPALDRHCPTLLPEYYTQFSDAIRLHSSHATKLVYSYDPRYAGYDENNQTMYVPVCQPDPELTPRHSPLVEEWLKGTFGLSAHYERFMDYMCRVYNLEAPVCALYIVAPAGVGKNLLVRGLARRYSREAATANFEKLLADFNQPLLDSPFIVADEKVPTDRRGANESAVIRQWVGNDGHRINAKYRTEATLLGYPRMFIIANNDDALRIREDLTEQDIEAIRVRLGYIRVPDEATGFLNDMAVKHGYDTVRDMVDPWVRDGTIARHMMWLAQTRDVEDGDRFLVEGWESSLTQNLPANVGSAGLVTAAAVSAILSGTPYTSVRWFGGHVYVSNALLPRDWEYLMPNERMPGNHSRLKALKSMSAGETAVLDVGGGIGQRQQKYYYVLPGDMVARLAAERGEADAATLLAVINREAEDEQSFGKSPDADHETILDTTTARA
jgi:hypothetical protein